MDRHWNTRVGGGECGVFALFYLNEKTKNFPETKKHLLSIQHFATSLIRTYLFQRVGQVQIQVQFDRDLFQRVGHVGGLPASFKPGS